MKRAFRILALLLALLIALSMTAGAATVYDLNRVTTTYTDCKITLHKTDGTEVSFTTGKINERVECVFTEVEKIKLRFTPKDKTEDFMVFMLKGADATVPQQDNIVYLNQNDAADEQNFTIYPSALAADTYKIYVSSAAGYFQMGSLIVTDDAIGAVGFVLGNPDDVNDEVDVNDAVWVLKYIVYLIKAEDCTENQKLAADTDRNGAVEPTDAINILKYQVGLINTF